MVSGNFIYFEDKAINLGAFVAKYILCMIYGCRMIAYACMGVRNTVRYRGDASSLARYVRIRVSLCVAYMQCRMGNMGNQLLWILYFGS
jgi:hypothetical protein